MEPVDLSVKRTKQGNGTNHLNLALGSLLTDLNNQINQHQLNQLKNHSNNHVNGSDFNTHLKKQINKQIKRDQLDHIK